MRDYMKYVNHIGEIIEFGKGYILINENDLRDYKWEWQSINENIAAFERKINEKTLPVIVYGPDAKSISDTIYEIIEKDILEKKSGKLYIGDFYISGYFCSKSASRYTSAGSVEILLKFVCESNRWCKKTIFQFSDTTVSSSDNKKYPYNYDYRYDNSMGIANIVNPHFSESNFKMIMYGPAVNPVVTIGGKTHLVYIVLEDGERVEIDSQNKTVTKYLNDSTAVNAFHNRQKVSSFFAKVSSGSNAVSWKNTPVVDLIIYEERSEPKWQ